MSCIALSECFLLFIHHRCCQNPLPRTTLPWGTLPRANSPQQHSTWNLWNIQAAVRWKFTEGLNLTCSSKSTQSDWLHSLMGQIINNKVDYIKIEVFVLQSLFSERGKHTSQAWNNVTVRASSWAVYGFTVAGTCVHWYCWMLQCAYSMVPLIV